MKRLTNTMDIVDMVEEKSKEFITPTNLPYQNRIMSNSPNLKDNQREEKN